MRWASRLAPFGAPIWTTRSTSPQSMPRSSVEVQTTARSLPAAIAASTLRRWPASSEPWWRAIGRPSVLIRHSSWKISSAWLRVLTKSSAILCAAIGLVDVGDGIARRMARPGHALVGFEDGDLGLGAARDRRRGRRAPRPRAPRLAADQPAAQRVRIGDGRRQADGLEAAARACAGARGRATRRSPRLLVTSACSSSRMTVSRSAKKRSASGAERSRATCSGVVSRMSGGFSFWRWRLCSGVSPVRVSRRTSGRSRRPAARGCGRCRRRAPSAARCRACGCRGRRAAFDGGRSVQGDEARQEAGQRLAGAGRRDQQGRAPGLRLGEQLELVRARVQPRAANQAANGAAEGRLDDGAGGHGVRASAGAARPSGGCTASRPLYVLTDRRSARERDTPLQEAARPGK